VSAFILWIIWSFVVLTVALTLAYRRVDLKTSTTILGFTLIAYSLIGVGHWLWVLILWVLYAGMVGLNVPTLRRERISAPLLNIYRSMVPSLSDTEREALEAGTVWWDGELFSGCPDWSKLTAMPPARLTD